ncbi:MAG: hypothetical protein ACE5EM_07840 [Sphingomonadales bacterium]
MSFSRTRFRAAFAASLLLTGCVTDTSTVSGPELEPLLEPEPQATAPSVVARPEPAKPRPPKPRPSQLIGMTGEDVTALLGQPGLLRKEPPAEVWRYSGPDCVFHVFLYRDDRTQTVRVRHYESLDLKATPADATCFAALLEARLRD